MNGFEWDNNSNSLIATGVFSIIGISVLSIFDTTRHEKSQYIVPIDYMERKKLFLIAALINFTLCFCTSLLFIFFCFLVSKEYGLLTVKMFAFIGLPYIEMISFNKIYMYKGKRKKDNPQMVYLQYFIGFIAGLVIVGVLFAIDYIINKDIFNIIIILINILSSGYAGRMIYRIVTGDTSYENVKVNQLKVIRKVM
jgi:hypothetical protein